MCTAHARVPQMNNTIYHCSECGVREHQNKDHVECYKFFNNMLYCSHTHTHTQTYTHAFIYVERKKKWNDLKGMFDAWKTTGAALCYLLDVYSMPSLSFS